MPDKGHESQLTGARFHSEIRDALHHVLAEIVCPPVSTNIYQGKNHNLVLVGVVAFGAKSGKGEIWALNGKGEV